MINFVFASVLREFLFVVVLPFFVWLISFWGFVSGKLALRSDVFLYYWDSRFFLDNISHGVYPLWNPDYSGGVPWNFFLRRMGEVNPFYWTISILKLLGASPLYAHLIFFALYYFLGLVGFWLLAKLFLKDRLTSTGAYLLLLFTWGGQIFYCFELLMLVPLVWFFYFIFAFAKEQKKHQFLGACFTAALMVTTYIPFFTITIIGLFFFFFFLIFMKESINFLKATCLFVKKNKLFAALCLGFFLLVCASEFNFFLESKGGGFVMPFRHLGSTNPSELAVDTQMATGNIIVPRTVWDIIAYGYFDKIFSNHETLGIGDFSIAYPFFIIFLLAFINPASRRTAVLLVSGVFIILITMTKGRLNPFFLEHVFFFHYMRMLHLFFWLSVLPMAILMVMEQLRVFLSVHQGKGNIKILIFVVVVHILFLTGFLSQEGLVWSSCLVVGLSLVFFILSIMGGWDRRMLAVIFWLSLIIQPIVFAQYIEKNSGLSGDSCLMDRMSFYKEHILLPSKESLRTDSKRIIRRTEAPSIDAGAYYENPWFYNVRQNIDQDDIRRFVGNRLIFFDNSMPEDDIPDQNFFARLDKKWEDLGNFVFLPQASMPEDFRSLAPSVTKAEVVYEGSPLLKILSFDANTLRLETNLDRTRFLLWTNGYHSGWHVYIDGHESRLLRADYAFKGVWVPSGVHTVVFRFGVPLRYAICYFFMFGFLMMLVMVVVLGLNERFLIEKGATDEY